MKRPSKHQADVDLRGRVRRQMPEWPQPLVEAKFLDGPLAGTTRQVPKGADYVTVGPFTYSYAGKEGRVPLYCKVRKSRAERRMVTIIISRRGADPRVDMARARTTPAKRTAPLARGRGARRRAEKRANAAA